VKKAFSLIELMIVIAIIGVVYTLAITNLKSFDEEKVKPSLLTLKEYLWSFAKEGESAKLLCLDDCSECAIYVDGIKSQEIEDFFDSDDVKVYRYDFLQGAVEKKEDVFFNEDDIQERVCFSFEVNRNKISDQVIVVYKEKAYDFTTYFTLTQRYDSLEDLVEKKQNEAQKILR